MKKLIFILPLICIFGCQTELKPGQMNSNNGFVPDNYQDLRYFRDNETNVCYAERGVGNNYSFTSVECTEAVLNKIKLDSLHGIIAK